VPEHSPPPPATPPTLNLPGDPTPASGKSAKWTPSTTLVPALTLTLGREHALDFSTALSQFGDAQSSSGAAASHTYGPAPLRQPPPHTIRSLASPLRWDGPPRPPRILRWNGFCPMVRPRNSLGPCYIWVPALETPCPSSGGRRRHPFGAATDHQRAPRTSARRLHLRPAWPPRHHPRCPRMRAAPPLSLRTSAVTLASCA